MTVFLTVAIKITTCGLLTTAKVLDLFQGVVKVFSHQDLSLFSSDIELWAIAGNETADKAAALALQNLPAHFLATWEQCKRDRREQLQVRDALQQHFIAIGTACLDSKQAQRELVDQQWEEFVPPTCGDGDEFLSFTSLPAEVTLPVGHALEQVSGDLLRWLRHITTLPDRQPIWVSSYQLLVHFQQWSGQTVFCYDLQTKTWSDSAASVREFGFDFLKSAGWLQAVLKQFANTFDLRYFPEARVPHGSIFRCWTRCLLICTSPSTFAECDNFLAVQQGPVKSVRKAFGTLPIATPKQP